MRKLFLGMVVLAFSTSAFAFDTNVRLNPLSAALGVIAADVDFGVTEGLTVGPSLGLLSYSSLGVSLNAYQLGARANLFFNGKRFSDGFYFGPHVTYIPVTVKQTSGAVEYSATIGSMAAGALVGYHWMWSNGFNINLGLGATYYSTGDTVTGKSSTGTTTTISVPSFTGIVPGGELTLGLAF